jgi:hypothetical protein
MIKMIEVVGISRLGFAEAVKETIEKLIESGEKVYWFEIVEERGAVKEGKNIEFQVKIKVGVESK